MPSLRIGLIAASMECSFWTKDQIDTMAFAQEVQNLYKGCPMVLVGTKSDLREGNEQKSRSDSYFCSYESDWDFYSREEMERLRQCCQCVAYVECSALDGENVAQVFDTAVRAAIDARKAHKAASKKRCLVM